MAQPMIDVTESIGTVDSCPQTRRSPCCGFAALMLARSDWTTGTRIGETLWLSD